MKKLVLAIFIFLFCLTLSFAGQIVPPKFQAFDGRGNPLIGGKLYTYIAGTSSNKATYSDSALTTPNANPVILNARGEASIFGSGTYKFVLKDSDGNTIWTMDNISVLSASVLSDGDADTLIQVEESTDEDIIRFDINGTEQVTIQDGKIEPTTNNDIDLGSATKRFKAVHANEFIGYFQRAKFSYKDGSNIYIDPPGVYEVDGKIAIINSQLTQSGGTGSTVFYYVYIDYSEIPADGIILNGDTYQTSTAPSWSDSKNGWYHPTNTSDRCIFAILCGAVNIYVFYHDGGDFVQYDQYVPGGQTSKSDVDYDNIDVDTDWDDVYLPIPDFSTKALLTFKADANADSGNGILYYRTNGSAAATYLHEVIQADGDFEVFDWSHFIVFTDSSQIIEVSCNVAGDHTFHVWAEGWYFPRGM